MKNVIEKVEVIVEVPIEKVKLVEVEKKVEVVVIKEVVKEIIKEVPVELIVIKEVEKKVEVEVIKEVVKEVIKEVPVI